MFVHHDLRCNIDYTYSEIIIRRNIGCKIAKSVQMVHVWRTMDTTVRGRGNGCKSIATIAVIVGVYVSIVSVLRFGRFLAGFNCTTPPPDNDLSVSRKSLESYKIRERCRN